MTDARDVPLDEFEQEMLDRLLQAHDRRPARSVHRPAQVARRDSWRTGLGSRVGRRWQGRVMAMVLVGLTAASGAIAAVSIFGGSSPPVHLYGSYLCPTNYAYVAQVSTKLVFPPNYPGRRIPRGAGIRCFASPRYATASGFRVAPPPRGDIQVGSIYVGPTPASVRRTCRAAQRATKSVVFCPSRLPTPWIHPAVNWDCPTSACPIPLLSLTGSFTAPSSFVGSAPGVGEATLWSASSYQQRVFPYLVGCFSAPARLVSRAAFRGHPAAWYQCSIFGDSTSTMLEWQIGKQSYGISVDGPPGLSRTLVEYIAAHLIAQRPSARHA